MMALNQTTLEQMQEHFATRPYQRTHQMLVSGLKLAVYWENKPNLTKRDFKPARSDYLDWSKSRKKRDNFQSQSPLSESLALSPADIHRLVAHKIRQYTIFFTTDHENYMINQVLNFEDHRVLEWVIGEINYLRMHSVADWIARTHAVP